MKFWHAVGVGLSIHTIIWAHESGSELLEGLAFLALVAWLWDADPNNN